MSFLKILYYPLFQAKFEVVLVEQISMTLCLPPGAGEAGWWGCLQVGTGWRYVHEAALRMTLSYSKIRI